MIEQHKVLMNAGHSEYWDAGTVPTSPRLVMPGSISRSSPGTPTWWKTRWANSQFGNEPYRTLITYKESLDSTQSDPADPPTWTGAWRDPRFSPPGDGAQPENALTGQLWTVNCCSYADTGAVLPTPSCESGEIPPWPACQSGQTYTMPDETLGYEWDSDVDNGFRPAGEIDMSQTCEKRLADTVLTVTEEIGPRQCMQQPDPVPGRQRCARLRCGHGPVGVGA